MASPKSDPPAAGSPEDGSSYQCQRCANCCRWPGEVVLKEKEIAPIARFLGLEEEPFIRRHTRLRRNRTGLCLVEQSDGACIFLEGNDCLINKVKPAQCRGFPNQWNFPGWRQVCEAIPVKKKTADPRCQ